MGKKNMLFGRLILDADFYITEVDDKFAEALGYTREEMDSICPVSYADFINPEEVEGTILTLSENVKKQAVAVVYHKMLRKDTALVSVVINAELIDDKTVIATVIFDTNEITDFSFSKVSTIPFTYDFQTDILVLSKEYEKVFKRRFKVENFMKECDTNTFISEDSKNSLREFLAESDRINSGSLMISLRDAYGEFRWFTLSIRCVFDNDGKAMKATGFIVPSSEGEGTARKADDQNQFENESLGIYGRNALEARVKRRLLEVSEKRPAAMILMKFDDMIEANRKLGRFAVDTIIHNFLFTLLSEYGHNIVGRFGGINYAMYVEKCGGEKEVADIARRIRDILGTVLEESGSPSIITISIGITIIKEPVAYKDLYNSVEDALSSALSMGGNTYMIYSDSIEGERFIDKGEGETRVSEYVTGEMWSSFIDKLYSGQAWDKSIKDATAFIGNIFRADRITVVEIPKIKHVSHRVIQWAREGIKDTTEILERMDVSSIYFLLTKGIYDDSNETFCCYDVCKYEDIYVDIFRDMDIRSFVQCRMYDEGSVIGYISMEMSDEPRVWFKQEIDFLRLMSKLIGRNISAKNALDTVENLNERIQNVIDKVDSSIYVIDKYNYTILYYNHGFEKRVSIEEKSKKTCFELVYGRKEPCEFCPLSGFDQKGKDQSVGMVVDNFGIDRATVDVSASEMMWDNTPAYIINISEHLESPEEAERRRVQELIEQKYAFIYSHSCEIIIDINMDDGSVKYTLINQERDGSVENHYYDSYNESFQNWTKKYLHPEDKRRVRNVFSFDGIKKNIEKGKNETRLEYRCVYPDGSVRWKESHGFYISTESGTSYVIARNDITERRLEIEKSVLNKKSLYAAVFNVYKRVMLVNLTEDNYTVLSMEDASSTERRGVDGAYSDYIMNEIADKYEADEFPTIKAIFARDSLLQVFNSGENRVEYETRRYNAIGELHWVSILAIGVHNSYNDDKMAIVLIRNIDNQKEAEISLREAYNAAENANNAKSDFLSRMSHEIRTPMNAIIGMNEIAKNSINDPKQVAYCLEKMDLSSHYLLSIINDVLDMSRIESGKMIIANNPFDFSSFVEDIRTLIIPQAQSKGLEFQIVEKNISSESYIGDITRIKQILINLISNSLKFTKSGGKITLEICEMSVLENKSVVMRFIVADTGIGMSQEFIERMYRPFEQESASNVEKEHGTGLGLSITKNLVYLMGGHIDVRSEVGVGTEFEVELRLGISEESSRKPAAAKKQTYDFSGKNVLAVEDNEINMEIICALLESKNFNVVSAENGEEALKKFKESEDGFFDVIVMDIMMPVMNGLEASFAIRSLDREDAKLIPIIAMTANAFDDDVSKSIAHGMNDHLAKPVEPDKLFSTLASYVEC